MHPKFSGQIQQHKSIEKINAKWPAIGNAGTWHVFLLTLIKTDSVVNANIGTIF
jgi:hypothetical protein